MTKKELKKDLLKENGIEIWPENKIKAFRQTLLQWYDDNKRDLPWRQTSDPYHIWVSEIMLQQTQVVTVIPYYNRFLETLPSIKDLAEASEETIIKLWEGLGYYSRVRNMKAAAIQIMNDFNGVFPRNKKDILTLKGIGPYTAGAISSIAFNQAEPAVDGNVMRVMSRLFEIDLDIGKASSRKVFEALIDRLIDPDRPGDFNQALMDLGATICTPKNYNPSISPVKEFNASFVNESWEQYPIKAAKKAAREEEYVAVAIQNKVGEYAFVKRPSKGVLAGMWTYIMIDAQHVLDSGWKSFKKKQMDSTDLMTRVEDVLLKEYGLQVSVNELPKGEVTHVFSHIKWKMTVCEAMLIEEKQTLAPIEWIHPSDYDQHAFPMPTQKIQKLVSDITLF